MVLGRSNSICFTVLCNRHHHTLARCGACSKRKNVTPCAGGSTAHHKKIDSKHYESKNRFHDKFLMRKLKLCDEIHAIVYCEIASVLT